MNDESSRNAEGATPRLGQWWWLPPSVVTFALLSLLIAPFTSERRTRQLRTAVTTGERARTALNDFEPSLATELLERIDLPFEGSASPATENKLDADLADLRITLAEIDGSGRARYDS